MTEFKVNIWQLLCNVEAQYVLTTRIEEEGPPTLCPNDHVNRSNISNVRRLGTVDRKETTILEPTMGIFEAKMFKYAIPSGTVGDKTTFIEPFANNIEVWKTAIEITPDLVGDKISICVAPGATIGMLTAPVSSGFILDVPPATVNSIYLFNGCVIELYDSVGMQTQDMGYLTNIDKDLNQLTVQIAVGASFPAGTLVKMYNYMLRDYEMAQAGYRLFGDKGFKSKMIPANTPIAITLQNNTGLAKNLFLHVEHYKY